MIVFVLSVYVYIQTWGCGGAEEVTRGTSLDPVTIGNHLVTIGNHPVTIGAPQQTTPTPRPQMRTARQTHQYETTSVWPWYYSGLFSEGLSDFTYIA